MDLDADDALDYEDDTVGPTKIGSEDGKEIANSKLPCGDDDYLQIDCSEEEELVSGEQPLGSPSPEAPARRPPQPVTSGATAAEAQATEPEERKGADGGDASQGRAKKQKIVIGDADSSQNSGPKDVGRNREAQGSKKAGKKCKAMKRFRPFPRRPALRRKFAKNLSSTPWLPQYNFLDGTAGELQHLRPLMSFNKGLAISNSINGVAPSSSGYTQPICQPLISGSPFLPSPGISGFNVFGNNLDFQSPVYKNSEPIAPLKNDIKKTSAAEQGVDVVLKPNANTQNSLLGDAESYFKRICFQNGNGGQLKEFGQKYGAQSTGGLVRGQENYSIKLDALKEDEKALVKLKKEARLKRFMQNDVVKKEGKPLKQNVDKIPDKFLGMKLAFVKLEKPELSKEKSLRVGDRQESNDSCSSSLGAPKLKKEVLLKKQNPFEMTDLSVESRIKQEVLEGVDLKVKSEGSNSLRAACAEGQVKGRDDSEVAKSVGFGRADLATAKQKETGPNVKFVRTISKSLVELGFAKPKTGVAEGNGKFPLLLSTSPFAKEGFQKLTEPQLTGCIVKVFNLSPKTTANDILSMCSRVGTVKEVKLNFPKENSAVIRFEQSASAENFFGLYHGQKMDDYFLNVIVI